MPSVKRRNLELVVKHDVDCDRPNRAVTINHGESTVSIAPRSSSPFLRLVPAVYTPRNPFTIQGAPSDLPTLWIQIPWGPDGDVLSSDVECLKWQAYLALRGLSDIAVRWDVSADGALDARLPNLHVPLAEKDKEGGGELLPTHLIPGWVDARVGEAGPLEGYADEASRDESRAWVALMEGNVHAALALCQPAPSLVLALLSPYSSKPRAIETMLNPPPAPFTGISSLLPPYGTHINRTAIELQYKEAIAALSERLGTDKWFLGSTAPTALDALIFAYLHCILHVKDNAVRFEVTRRVNLVAWERRVQHQVRAAFNRLEPVVSS
ncbi:hypothetical protein A0H81_04096 [Grifola frondosa]|uniref:Metaxin glutathione S-transferase domain-containing protein n=1 Tax=Grifola frondosa TaxID=5627 RepID=A0A1C7MEM0_GRIFR|nr:hypothetical protein A0H81_04096 [Grifola frondosa]